MSIDSSRRLFIRGLASIIAAPAIVRAASLMPVRSFLADGGFYALDQPLAMLERAAENSQVLYLTINAIDVKSVLAGLAKHNDDIVGAIKERLRPGL